MSELEIGIVATASIGKTGALLWQPCSPITDSESDVEGFGNCQVFQSLGLASMPWPKTEEGYAETLFARGIPGADGVCLGGRDTRSAKTVGNLKPGDTVLYSTGPNQAAQLQLKEEKRQAALLTEDADGKTQLVLLDGKAKKLTVFANGSIFEMKDGGISLFDSTGKAGIIIKGGKVNILGNLVIGNGQNPLSLMTGPLTGSPGGPASVPLIAAKGITIALAFALFLNVFSHFFV